MRTVNKVILIGNITRDPLVKTTEAGKKVAMFTILMKCCFAQGYFSNEYFIDIVFVIALLSMFVGNTLALQQKNVKRLMAYSSIAHFGYLLIVLMVSSTQSIEFAWQSALFYLSAYVLGNVSIFTVLLNTERMLHNNTNDKQVCIDDWQGMFWRDRLQAVLLIFSVLSLAGIPLTMGFIGKFYLLNQAVLSQSWWLIAGLVIGSGIGLAYYLPIIFSVFKPLEKHELSKKTVNYTLPVSQQFFIFILIIASFCFGLFPDTLTQFV